MFVKFRASMRDKSSPATGRGPFTELSSLGQVGKSDKRSETVRAQLGLSGRSVHSGVSRSGKESAAASVSIRVLSVANLRAAVEALYEGKDMRAVLTNIHSLGRVAQSLGFCGPPPDSNHPVSSRSCQGCRL